MTAGNVPLILLRHAPTRWNAQGRLQGRRDIPLSEAGRWEARGYRLPDDLVRRRWFVSPLRRARETAALTGLEPARVEPGLLEMDWGAWEGERLADLRWRLGAALAGNEARGLDFRPQAGESPREVQQRLTPWLARLAQQGLPAGAVAHKGIIRALYAWALNWDMTGAPPEKLQNSCYHLFEITPAGTPRLIALNRPLTARADRRVQ
tara:strand:- start:5320 stop:5940 length:621 start_codon:yes stop_codon:yes gene_type:complete